MSFAPLQAASSPPLNRNLGAIFGAPNPQGGMTMNQSLPSVPSVGYNIPPPPNRKRKQTAPQVDPALSGSPLDPAQQNQAHQLHASPAQQQQQQQQQQQHLQQPQHGQQGQHGQHGQQMPGVGAVVAGIGGLPGGVTGTPSAPASSTAPSASAMSMAPPAPGAPAASNAPATTAAAPGAPQAPPTASGATPGQAPAPPTPGAAPTATPAIGGLTSPPAAKKSRTNTPWSPAEEQRLKAMRDAGNSWSEIAKTFPTRTEGSVKKHWYKDMHYAEFAEDESAALLAAIKEYENNKWKVIGQKVGKPAKACEQYAKEHFGGGKN